MEKRIYEDNTKLILAKKYQNQKTYLTVISSAILFLYTIFFVLFFLEQDQILVDYAPFFSGIYYFIIYYVLRTLLAFPFEIYQSFKLPKKIGISNETFSLWITNQFKSFVLVLFFGSFASGLLLICIENYPDFWWVYFSVLISGFFIFIFLFGQTIIAPLFFNFEKLSDSKIEKSLLNLRENIGFKGQSDIWVMKTKKYGDYANAFISGFGPTRKIVITESVLEYNPEEIECIVAHELAHLYFSHNLLLCVYKIVSFIGFFYIFKLLLDSEYLPINDLDIYSVNTIGILLIFFLIFNFIISPIFLMVSRKMEFACDLFALKYVSNQSCLISILKKLCTRNFCDPNPPYFFKIFFYTHPPFSERIKRLISLMN